MYYIINRKYIGWDFSNGDIELYNSEMNKVEKLTEKEYIREVKKVNVFGHKFKKFIDYTNEIGDCLFIVGTYMYYIYKSFVIIYKNGIAKIYEYKLMYYCVFDIGRGKVRLYYRISPNRFGYIEKQHELKEIQISKQEFLQNYKSILLKYILTRE